MPSLLLRPRIYLHRRLSSFLCVTLSSTTFPFTILAVMIVPQLSRAVRATTHNTVCTAQQTATCTRNFTAPSFCLAHRPHQRRLSSSKASCPPDDGSDRNGAAASSQKTAHTARSQAVRGNGPRPSRTGRKSKEVESQFKQDGIDAMFSKLPRVPSTNDMRMQRSGMSDNTVVWERSKRLLEDRQIG